ncbi:MAG: tetratricopeptide repeat protein [Candidatus Thorarchaeota archaeon]
MTEIGRKNLQEYSAIVALNEEKLLKNSNDHEALNEKGIAHLLLKQYQLAIQSLKNALEIAPENTNYLLNLIDAFIQAKEFQEAYNFLSEFHASSKNNIEILFQLGFCLQELGQQEKANQFYYEVIGKNQQHMEANTALANYYFKEEQYRKAEIFLKRILQIKKEDTESRMKLAICSTELGNYDEAIVNLEELLQKDITIKETIEKEKRFAPLRITFQYDNLIESLITKKEFLSQLVLVDGSNVAHYQRSKNPSMGNLVAVREKLLHVGFTNIVFITGNKLHHYIDDLETFREWEKKGFLNKINVDMDDDEFLLTRGSEWGALIVSNDLFREYIEKNKELLDYLLENRITYMIVDGKVDLHSRKYRSLS